MQQRLFVLKPFKCIFLFKKRKEKVAEGKGDPREVFGPLLPKQELDPPVGLMSPQMRVCTSMSSEGVSPEQLVRNLFVLFITAYYYRFLMVLIT